MVVLSVRPKKKPPGFSALAVFLGFGLSLAGPVRQQAGRKVEAKKEKSDEPALHAGIQS
jgi:hypothetical protein